MYIRIIELNCRCGVNFHFRLKDPSHGHLFVRFKSHARVLTGDGFQNAEPGDYIFYRGEEEIAYESGNWAFKHDYFRFYLDEDESQLFALPTSKLFKAPISSKLEDLLRLMMLEYYSGNENRTLSLALYGKLFLLAAQESIKDTNSALLQKNRREMLALRIEMLSFPEKEWTVEQLAEKIHLSPSYFQGLYKKTFGISPVNDLIEARIQKAESYLLSTLKKESEIARLSGYRNIEHFIRQFKKARGVTPSEFRNGKR